MSVSANVEHNKQLIGIYKVLSAVMVPTGCQHSAMELYFEHNTNATDKAPCEKFCSFCTERVKKHAGEFQRENLRDIMMANLFNDTLPHTFDSVLKFFKTNKKLIYIKGKVPNKLAGQYHGLFLQLLTNGIFELAVDEKEAKNIGTNKLLGKHVVVKLGRRVNTNDIRGLALMQDSV